MKFIFLIVFILYFGKYAIPIKLEENEDYSPFGVLSDYDDRHVENLLTPNIQTENPKINKNDLMKNDFPTEILNSHEFIAKVAQSFLPKKKIKSKILGENYEFRKDFRSPSAMHAYYYLNTDKL